MLWRFLEVLLLVPVILVEPRRLPKCVTGYMTDVQQWVDVEGRLTDSIDIENAIDLSTQMNPVSMLHQKMNFFKFSDTRRVKYLSMAKCWLSRIPPVFRITDPSGRWLSDTVEFMTFYGNFFVEVDLPGEHYYVSMNASGAREAEFVSTYQPAQSKRILYHQYFAV
ncbi:hypothetical protein O3G_MSEX008775 [Manduca sexta]|uniref:Uncharacterized protein n=1 Tax=Manduca sexta TaxID=7130 RepID=A0A921ZD46_MANSE|nr:hypothetical protein O3G_MSEX008775 [Manduca sexta]